MPPKPPEASCSAATAAQCPWPPLCSSQPRRPATSSSSIEREEHQIVENRAAASGKDPQDLGPDGGNGAATPRGAAQQQHEHSAVISALQLQAAWWLATTLGWAKSMLRNTRSGAARPSAHRKGSPKLYLRSSEVYFDAHCDHSLPHMIVASETTQHTPWTLKAFESHCRTRDARCTCWSSTNGSAATKCSAHPTGAQAGLKPLNGCRMTENACRRLCLLVSQPRF